MSALTLPGIEVGLWQVRHQHDPAARFLADRHYSRRRPGTKVGGPWRKLILVAPDEQALWLSTWSNRPMDGLDAWRCNIFRNEGPELSSDLIIEAMRITADQWLERHGAPDDGWVTWVDTRKVASENPGYCFRMAGWWRDKTYEHPYLFRFRADVCVADEAKQ